MTDTATEFPADLLAKIALFKRQISEHRLLTYAPYPWQRKFHEAGEDATERMLMAANGVGKTNVAGAEVAIHMRGDYDKLPKTFRYPKTMVNGRPHPFAGDLVWPDGWHGKRFTSPVEVWTGSPTNETSKQNVQPILLGGLGEQLGTGWIPKQFLHGKPTTRQAGVKDVIDSFQVRHISGGLSSCYLKTYEQGWQKWQGGKPHVVWLDEEPDDYMIYSEAQTRILRTNGIILVTMTPLLGETELTLHFREGIDGTYLQGATWDDAPHLSDEQKTRMMASYRAHERKARTEGIPMMGEGAVFPVDDDQIRVSPFKIPDHFARIKGCDFGIDHPAAGAEIAVDRDQDIIYVIDCYRKANESAPYHAAWFNKSNRQIPVAWPHDGMNREKRGGETIANAYRQHGVNMLAKSARYPKVPGQDEKGGPQPVEPIVDEVLERMQTGRFKVFANLSDFFDEKRSYHRKDGLIVPKRDDILKATFYAVMMKRYAMPLTVLSRIHSTGAPQTPIASTRVS